MIPIYGIDKELAAKQASKYDPKREQEAQDWLEEVLKEKVFSPQTGDFHDQLKDGVILARVMNAIVPGSCKIQQSAMPFKQMENINSFLAGAERLGVPRNDLFQTVDLFEKKNPLQVVDAIFAFARHAQKQVSWLPPLGPKLAEKRDVQFSNEQLNAGKYMPTQQSGHFAALKAKETGATGSGIIYGSQRQITDQRVGTGDSMEPSQQSGHHVAREAAKTGATASGIRFGQRREIGGTDPGRQ